jgi:hypothetical protein
LGLAVRRKTLHPGVDVLGMVDLAGVVDFCVGGERFFDEAADLFLIRGVAFDGLDDQAVGGTSGLLGECAKSGAEFGGKTDGCGGGHGEHR